MSAIDPNADVPLEAALPDPTPAQEERMPLFAPHRVVFMVLAAVGLYFIVTTMRWEWLPKYYPMIIQGLVTTIWILVVTLVLGMLLAIPVGLVQVTGPKPLAWLAKAFCTTIRGTPLLLQIWLLYYGLGSIFPLFPEIRQSFLWNYLREAWPYALVALTVSFAAYEGEVMRGAFAGVPKGELEAARAFGMSPWKVLRRVWLPRALHRALPTLAGETVLQLKSTPLIATITVLDAYGAISRVRSATYITYEPLLLLALMYMILTGIIVVAFRYFENRIPTRGV